MRLNLKKLRKSKGWTQAQTSVELDISLDYVRSLESGRKTPSLQLLTRIAEKFGCKTIDEVIEREAS